MSLGLRFTSVVLCIVAIGLASVGFTQGPRRAGQRAMAPQNRMGQADPKAKQQQMMQRMRQRLGTSQAEWEVIQPRLEKVMELSRQADRRGPGAMQPRPNARRKPAQASQGQKRQERRPRNNTGRDPSAVQKASAELQTLLANSNATPEQIEARLKTLRGAREAARRNLAEAHTQLQQVVTVKQEAQLVLMGLLE